MSGARGMTIAVLVAIGAMAFGGCSMGGPEVSSRASCDGPAFTSEEMPTAAPQTLILVELSRNDEAAREAVIQAIDPTLTRAVSEGGVVRLLVSGGEGMRVSKSTCLSGDAAIMVDRNNEETERRARNTALDAIEGSVSAQLEAIEIAPRGNLSNLLAATDDELRSLAAAEGTVGGAPASVLVVSDLTSPAPVGDCLNLDGVRANQAVADAVIARCLETGQVRRLPEGVALQIVRPQLTPGDSAGARMSAFLVRSICGQMTNQSDGCAPSAVGRG